MRGGSIILTGFMGTGKTAVGRLLATRLGRPFVDTDALIEGREGLAVSDIFARKGEQYFRGVERRVVEEVCGGEEGAVVATGGGAISDEGNWRRMRQSGVIVCLTASPQAILARVGERGERPLLQGGEPMERIQSLLSQRAEAYARADITIDTSALSVEEVVDELLRSVGS